MCSKIMFVMALAALLADFVAAASQQITSDLRASSEVCKPASILIVTPRMK